jgi:hypothetical protein
MFGKRLLMSKMCVLATAILVATTPLSAESESNNWVGYGSDDEMIRNISNPRPIGEMILELPPSTTEALLRALQSYRLSIPNKSKTCRFDRSIITLSSKSEGLISKKSQRPPSHFLRAMSVKITMALLPDRSGSKYN